MKNYKRSKAVKDEYYAEQKRDKVAAAKKEGKQDSTKNCTLNLTSMRSTDAMSFSVSAVWRTAHCIMPLMFSTWPEPNPPAVLTPVFNQSPVLNTMTLGYGFGLPPQEAPVNITKSINFSVLTFTL